MLALGVVLLVLATVLVVAALVGGSDDSVSFDLGLFEVETNTLGAFLLGATTTLLLVVGLGLLRTGIRRSSRRRREHRELSRLTEVAEARDSQRGAPVAGQPDPAHRVDQAEPPRSDADPRRSDPG